ncbi:hypothetical protein ACH5RR_029490 [Cinchona calisaya]|uniref:Protein ARV n=1 Tax=Cinchona calisaya TaxID=153742 RepID=A0ABD2YRS9_9GENT
MFEHELSSSSSKYPSEKHIRTEKDGDFQCVECCFPIKRLYIQYSPGNIRLKRCENCKNVADEYIECEHMITVIDLILHKPKAYRHLFYNKFTKGTLDFEGLLWGSTLGYLILDAYAMSILSLSEKDWTSAMSFASLWHYYGEFLIGIIVGNVVFMLILLIGFEKFINASAAGLGCKHIVLAILVSCYFKIFLVAMMVWEFPSSVVFMIDMFILSSNTVALKVLGNAAAIRCLGVSFAAYAVKFLTCQWLRRLL